ncbi:MAG: DUF1302 family protein [Dissulfuribacterales bacterium]
MKKTSKFYFIAVVFLFLTLWLGSAPVAASPLDGIKDAVGNIQDRSTFHGFLQQSVSFNTEDPIETEHDDKWKASMIRSTLYGDIYTDLDWSRWTVRFRYDLEYPTAYGDRLQDLPNAFDPDGGAKINNRDQLEDFDVREWFGDFQIGKRNLLRLGKQQVVWGKTDFFSGLDIVNGYDSRWRTFLEPENEQRRKPLIMANLTTELPELDGSFQFLFRPGWDRDKDIGNSYDLYGGRWANQPNKGNNFLAPTVTPYNLDHKKGDQDDPCYGIRWSGVVGDVEYTLNYLHWFSGDPVLNPSETTFGALGAKHYKEEPKGGLGDLIFKQVDIAGFTVNYYVAPLDIIVRCETSYTWDAPYNYGKNFGGGALPGFAGVKEKDTVRLMGAFDKDVDFPQWMLGSYRPGFLSMQVFDTWIMDYKDDDDLVYNVGYGKRREEHETIVTAILSWYYDYDQIVPQVAGGLDTRGGGGFFIPSVKFAYGNNWRLLVEYDMFFGGHSKKAGEIEDDCAIFGYFDHNDQLYLRLTYQF